MTIWFIWTLACSTPSPVTAEGDFPALNPADPDVCESHVDCVLSDVVDGSCCDALCGPDQTRNRLAEASLKEHRTQVCTGASFACPVASCVPPPERVPRCVEGRCTAVVRPD